MARTTGVVDVMAIITKPVIGRGEDVVLSEGVHDTSDCGEVTTVGADRERSILHRPRLCRASARYPGGPIVVIRWRCESAGEVPLVHVANFHAAGVIVLIAHVSVALTELDMQVFKKEKIHTLSLTPAACGTRFGYRASL